MEIKPVVALEQKAVYQLDSRTRSEDRTLKGHSGCTITLCQNEDGYFVKKTSASLSYNPRLLRQIKKQILLGKTLSLPKVIDCYALSGLVTFEMEYIPGRDFKTHLLHYERIDSLYISTKILSLFKYLASFEVVADPARELRAKLLTMKNELYKNSLLQDDRALLENSLEYLGSLDWKEMPSTVCHGDLTLENIIFTADGEMTFIDVLDENITSFWLDVGKLLFDLNSGWSLRDELWEDKKSYPAEAVALITKFLAEAVQTGIRKDFPALAGFLVPLQILQALRVLQYVKNDSYRCKLTNFIQVKLSESRHV